MGVSVQFNNKGAVCEAFESRQVEAWSIFQNKQFMFKGMGADDFKTIIETLSKGETAAVYTVKVYESVEDASAIKNNTPDDGSFNFRLAEENYRDNYLSEKNSLSLRMERLEELLLHEDDEEKPKIGGLGAILENPNIAPLVPVFIEKIVSLIFPPVVNTPAAIAPAQIGNISSLSIDQIIEELKKHDDNLKDHLQKLLSIAESNPQLFKSIINTL